ncbi:MAG TPA: sulfatase-like hydrolase/transferase, partial [Candidatus Limnocylindrales bacterium]|nr:sulfatase-like hydrolase/transferase [Candidatus Limnocylindrales bacterium]
PPTVPGVAERPLRDVYYLVLDRYGSDRSLSLWLDVENDLTAWLTDRDFRVLPDSAANYVKTALSMASTLNMTYLDDLAARMGPDSDDHAPVFSMLQDSAVVRQFKSLGYTYHHIGSWFGPTKTDSAADRNLFVGGPSDFGAALYDSSAIPAILKRLRIRTTVGTYERAYATNRFGWDAVRSVRDEPGPKLVVAHFLLPHPPYAFAADGTYLDEEAGKRLTERQRFEGQLAWTNTKIREMVEDLQSLPEDRRPIIILQADEGPYPAPYQRNTVTYDWSTATPEQLWQKFGILNAWYIPDGVDPGLYDTMTSVNTFPTLFSGYFGLPTPRLEDRSYTSASKVRPYDLDDITDRLSSGR